MEDLREMEGCVATVEQLLESLWPLSLGLTKCETELEGFKDQRVPRWPFPGLDPFRSLRRARCDLEAGHLGAHIHNSPNGLISWVFDSAEQERHYWDSSSLENLDVEPVSSQEIE